MENVRRIKASEIVADLRSGMGNVDLMDKYQITAKGLHTVFRTLLDAKAAIEGTGTGHGSDWPTPDGWKGNRFKPRQYLMVRLPVYFSDRLAEEGIVVDITEYGLQIAGLESNKGKVEGILIQADEFADIYPFQVEAQCRWTGKDRSTGQPVAGFEIVNMTSSSREQLRRLVRVLSMGEA